MALEMPDFLSTFSLVEVPSISPVGTGDRLGGGQSTPVPIERTSENLSFGLNFSTDLSFLHELDPIVRYSLVSQFLLRTQPMVAELFVYTSMPREFALIFAELRARRTVKEGFRRTMLHFYGPQQGNTVVDRVLTHIRKTGVYTPDALPTILGRGPTETESKQVKDFLSCLSNEELRKLLSTHTK